MKYVWPCSRSAHRRQCRKYRALFAAVAEKLDRYEEKSRIHCNRTLGQSHRGAEVDGRKVTGTPHMRDNNASVTYMCPSRRGSPQASVTDEYATDYCQIPHYRCEVA